MLNGTWTIDPFQDGCWNNAASVGYSKDPYTNPEILSSNNDWHPDLLQIRR